MNMNNNNLPLKDKTIYRICDIIMFILVPLGLFICFKLEDIKLAMVFIVSSILYVISRIRIVKKPLKVWLKEPIILSPCINIYDFVKAFIPTIIFLALAGWHKAGGIVLIIFCIIIFIWVTIGILGNIKDILRGEYEPTFRWFKKD